MLASDRVDRRAIDDDPVVFFDGQLDDICKTFRGEKLGRVRATTAREQDVQVGNEFDMRGFGQLHVIDHMLDQAWAIVGQLKPQMHSGTTQIRINE